MAKVLRANGMNKCIGCFTCMIACAAVNDQSHSLNKSRIKIKTAGGLQSKFICNICHACKDERPCVESCSTGALVERPGGGVILKQEKCIGCHKCVDACTIHAIYFDDVSKVPLTCKHCGICAKFCPHDCLKMEEV